MELTEALSVIQNAVWAAEPTRTPANNRRRVTRVRKPADILPEVRRFAKSDQEHFLVITLSGSHCIQKVHVVTKGLLNRTVVHPREVFKHAFHDRSAAIIVAHNHPSQSVEPSAEDHELTRRLVQAGQLLGIPVLDHVVFSEDDYYSFLEHDDI